MSEIGDRIQRQDSRRERRDGRFDRPAIAIVGMGCEYPEARSPRELWDNVLAKRRAFRSIPSVRLRREDYFSADRSAPDRSYVLEAALIEGYDFDRARFRVAGGAFRSADLTHWLALDVASRALADAGFAEGEGLPRETTGVLLGNSLTGEFSRASTLRLRWPYVRRVLDETMSRRHYDSFERNALLAEMEPLFKAPFEPVGEESLAGGLSNTIAGRICNHYDLKGGGYTVDGACSSSLLSVATACNGLVAGTLDVALAGGVDLSLDPFEIIGFAKIGALAPEEMRVYDARSAGFWPGEGCGILVLMRLEDALATGRRVYACLRGWGISSDGSGGITRPEVEGQLFAVRRAYEQAGYGPDSVAYFEGHGTGTTVGDATELKVLATARAEAGSGPPPSAVGSVKANIGHTKAAAGVAGLIKAALALEQELLPPTTGSTIPHPELVNASSYLRALAQGEPWPGGRPLRAGVSSMGFGGINVHVTLERGAPPSRRGLRGREAILLHTEQDAELFLFSGEIGTAEPASLLSLVDRVLEIAPGLARSEMADLAATLERRVAPAPAHTPDTAHAARAAVVASTPRELTAQLQTLRSWLVEGESNRIDLKTGVFLGSKKTEPRIGLLFTGQGAPSYRDGGAFGRRFPEIDAFVRSTSLPEGDGAWTAVAQPAIVTASLAGLAALQRFGISACVALGHSLGELTALHWGGGFDAAALLRIASARGAAMAAVPGPAGTMASVSADAVRTNELLAGEPVVISGHNAPELTTISGPADAVDRVVKHAREAGIPATRLKVSHAFHSPLLESSVAVLRDCLETESFSPLERTVLSTVTGSTLPAGEDLRALLCRQVLAPVRFLEALQAAGPIELLIEVGPGKTLAGLASQTVSAPVIPLDAAGPSLIGLLRAVGASYVLGARIQHAALFSDRGTRAFDLDAKPRFLVNPCELAPISSLSGGSLSAGPLSGESSIGSAAESAARSATAAQPATGSAVRSIEEHESRSADPTSTVDPSPQGTPWSPEAVRELVRSLVAQKVELPAESVLDGHRLLDDLHMNSIVVGQIVVEAASRLALPPVASPTDFADATLEQIAQALAERQGAPAAATGSGTLELPLGVDAWVRSFSVEWIERPIPKPIADLASGPWTVFEPETSADAALIVALREKLAQLAEGGVVVYLPSSDARSDASTDTLSDASSDADDKLAARLLAGAQQILRGNRPARFVLVHRGSAGASFAKTLHLEAAGVLTTVVGLPRRESAGSDSPGTDADRIVAEILATSGYSEVRYDGDGRRCEPFLRLLPRESVRNKTGNGSRPPRAAVDPLGPDDVLLVTGGGKGIGAESALEMGKQTGARLALLGRSDPAQDPELNLNLARFAEAGLRFTYFRGDVSDPASLRPALRAIEESLGPVTAVLHAAGKNEPRLIRSLDEESFRKTAAPKVDGAANLLAVLDPKRLRFFIAFGSIIGRTGMRGEADYALANERLTRLMERYQSDHPRCLCLALEWSVWSGSGMGERLGRVEALAREGVSAIPAREGLAILLSLLRHPPARTAVVISGRVGRAPTLQFEEPAEIPLLRFVDRILVHIPGVELIAETDLSRDTDPYLEDHRLGEIRVFPAVLGLEAMAQAFRVLTGRPETPIFEEVEFRRPMIIPNDTPASLRLAALVREDGSVETVLRSVETSFQVDHFRAVCRAPEAPGIEALPIKNANERHDRTDIEKPIPLNVRGLYGSLLFHRGRFRRIDDYLHLTAEECTARLLPDGNTSWFGHYLPPDLLLGDPGARDAAIHAIQACIPHARVLPVGVRAIRSGVLRKDERLRVRAVETRREGTLFVYDLEVTGANGEIRETWEGLQLRVVEETPAPRSWSPPLLVPYLERMLREIWPDARPRIALRKREGSRRRGSSDSALRQVLGGNSPVRRRADGKPEAAGGRYASAAHAGEWILALADDSPLACDFEFVEARDSEIWRGLLGADGWSLADRIRLENEDIDVAATRVWAARECLKKIGAPFDAPLFMDRLSGRGWVLLVSGRRSLATWSATLDGFEQPFVVAFHLEGEQSFPEALGSIRGTGEANG